MRARLQLLGAELRPGAMLGLSVSAIVGIAGLLQLDQRLMIIGIFAWPVIFVLNGVVVALGRWHRRHTRPGATYVNAEEVVRLQRLRSRQHSSRSSRPNQ